MGRFVFACARPTARRSRRSSACMGCDDAISPRAPQRWVPASATSSSVSASSEREHLCRVLGRHCEVLVVAAAEDDRYIRLGRDLPQVLDRAAVSPLVGGGVHQAPQPVGFRHLQLVDHQREVLGLIGRRGDARYEIGLRWRGRGSEHSRDMLMDLHRPGGQLVGRKVLHYRPDHGSLGEAHPLRAERRVPRSRLCVSGRGATPSLGHSGDGRGGRQAQQVSASQGHDVRLLSDDAATT